MSEGLKTPEELGLERQKPSRLERSSRLHGELFIKHPVVEGLGHLAEIPKDVGFVVATTHLSDVEVQIVAANIAQYRDAAVASVSINQEIPLVGGFMRWLTEGNLYDVTASVNPKTGQTNYRFRSSDFEAMETPIREGKGLVISAHQPVTDGKLPDRAGIGVVLLAQLTYAPVLPVVLDIDNRSSKPILIRNSKEYPTYAKRIISGTRPKSTLRYGEPITLEPIDRNELENFMKYFSRTDVKTLTSEQRAKAHQTAQKLRTQGEQIMGILASMLPPEKRGKW